MNLNHQHRHLHAATYSQLHGHGAAAASAAPRPPPYYHTAAANVVRPSTYGSSYAHPSTVGASAAAAPPAYVMPAGVKQQPSQYDQQQKQSHATQYHAAKDCTANLPTQGYAQTKDGNGYSRPASTAATSSSTLETELVFLIQNLCFYYKKALLDAIGQPSVLLPEDRSVFNPFARMDMLRASRTLRDACKVDLVPFMRTIVEGLKRCKYPINNIKNSLVLTVVYVERVLRLNPRAILFNAVDISRRFHTFLFCSFLLSHKWLEDEDVRNKSWARLLKTELTLNELNDMEALLFEILGYRLHVPNAVFDFWHSRMVVDTSVGVGSSSPSSSSAVAARPAATVAAAADRKSYTATSTDMEVDSGLPIPGAGVGLHGLGGVYKATTTPSTSGGSSGSSRHSYCD